MFRPDENPLGVPLVQVSLFDNESADKHYELGEALKGLREENVLIIGSGMAVHNLRYVGVFTHVCKDTKLILPVISLVGVSIL